MSVTSDLQTFLLSKTAITNIVGTAGVYWMRAPQGTDFPYITFQEVSDVREHDLAGQCGLVVASYQVDCWHKAGDVHALAEAVRTSIDGYTGTMTSTTVQYAKLTNRMEFAEPPEFGTEQTVDRIMLEIEMWVTESIPI